jgi:4-carboxymuconolactone decarboxylase
MTDRLPSLKPAELDATQIAFHERLVATYAPWADRSGFEVIGPDGSLRGPLHPLLFNPVLGAAQVDVFDADKASTSLPTRVHEVIVLTVGAAWGSDYELYAHGAVARSAGLAEDVVDALTSGRTPEFQEEAEAAAHQFTRQLVNDHRIGAQTYERAERLLGLRGVVDMVLLIGLYLATCSLINAFEIPAPRAKRVEATAPR